MLHGPGPHSVPNLGGEKLLVFKCKLNDLGGFTLRRLKFPFLHSVDRRVHQDRASTQNPCGLDRPVRLHDNFNSHGSLDTHPLGKFRVTGSDSLRHFSCCRRWGRRGVLGVHLARRKQSNSSNYDCSDFPHGDAPSTSSLFGHPKSDKVRRLLDFRCKRSFTPLSIRLVPRRLAEPLTMELRCRVVCGRPQNLASKMAANKSKLTI